MGMAALGKRQAVPTVLALRAPLNLEKNCHHCLGVLGQGILGSGQAGVLQNLTLGQAEKKRLAHLPSPHLQGGESLRGLELGDWQQVELGVAQID